MAGENPRRRRPCKVWDYSRAIRKSIMVAGLPELIVRGKEALGFSITDNIRVAVEEDGTEVEDVEYFQTLPDNTVYLLLRDGEKWIARPEDSKRNAELQLIRTVIPKAVREAVPALGLRDEAPTWQLADHKGLITIFLEWDLRASRPGRVDERPSLTLTSADLNAAQDPGPKSKETFINHIVPPPVQMTSRTRSPRQSSPMDPQSLRTSSLMHQHHGRHSEGQCDFHCCALHQAEGGQFHGITPTASLRKFEQHHVHFPRNEREYLNDNNTTSSGNTTNGTVVGAPTGATSGNQGESSESETEGNEATGENKTARKVLVLSDRVTADHRRHLSVRDLGVILDRLNSRIADVEALSREVVSEELYHWAIRATVRGETMRNLGVLYQGNYYLIREQTPTGNGRGFDGLDSEADTHI